MNKMNEYTTAVVQSIISNVIYISIRIEGDRTHQIYFTLQK